MQSDHYVQTIERIAAEAIENGWDLVSIANGKLGSLSITEYMVTIKAIIPDGGTEPALPRDWKR